jgi:mono/diheme cytochrome c family protein
MTNLKVFVVVILTLGVYTWVANAIPQLESVVPVELSFSADVTEAELVAAGEELFRGGAGCMTCHGLPTRAPNLLSDHAGEGTIGQRCDTRVEGQDCKTYLHESLTDPTAYVLEGFDPMVFAAALYSPSQIWAIVAFLQAQGGEVTVTGQDIVAAREAAAASAGSAAASLDPREIMRNTLCFGCHTLGDEGVALGPSFNEMGARIDAERIRRSILDPNAEIAEGYEHLAGSMPPNLGELLTDQQVDVLVEFLASQR